MKKDCNLLPLALSLTMMLLCGVAAWAADITARGTVSDGEGEPLIGVSVEIKNQIGRAHV